MALNAETNAQSSGAEAATKAAAVIPALNPAWPFAPTPIDLWAFGLNNDIAAKYIRPASQAGTSQGGS